MTLALLCSGQGRQHPGMFALTGPAPEAAPIFAAAAAVLDGQDLRDLTGGAAEAMETNVAGQILCCTQALAAHAALRGAVGPEVILAGYSVGELAAWGCAGVFSAATTLELARRRADAMDRAGGPDGGLAFVRGLRREAADGLCARFDAAVSIVNPGDAYVVGGRRRQLADLCEAASLAGATRSGMLSVQVASHTARLAAASSEFRAALGSVEPKPLRRGIRLLSGIDGGSVTDIRTGADKLAAQISQTVRWAACLESCIEAGVTVCLELGPGRSLADMVADAYPDAQARSIDEFRSLDGVRAWLARTLP